MILRKVLIAAAASFAIFAYSCKTVEPKPVAPAKPNDFLQKLALKLEKNDFDGALSLYDTLTPEEAASPQNRITKAGIYLSAGRPALAREEVNAVISSTVSPDPFNIEARYVLSVVEAAEKKLRQQRILLEDIIKDKPNFVPALNDLGRISVEMQKNLKKAANFYETALKAEPSNTDSLVGRSRVYRLEKKYDEALDMLNKAAAFHPKSAYVYNERGRLYRSRGALDEAITDMDMAVKLDPNSYWYSYDRGLTLIDKNRKREALDEFKRATRLNPNMFMSYVYTAGISDELGLDDEAEKSYKKIISLKPDYYFGFEGAGVHSLKKGDYSSAAYNFTQAWNYAKEETNYALLAAYSLRKADKSNSTGHKDNAAKDAARNIVNEAIKVVKRDTLDYYVLRLFSESMGDTDVARRVERESDGISKVRGYFYLSCFYELSNIPALAERYAEEFRKYDRRDLVEFRINEILHPDNNIVVKEAAPSPALR
ncbi:MAG: tetratricopeptide repeat protein [Spirochaetaceae bacterium]|jgi:tetratricopeptide (TPR) repeat protein|nr:tetratricopeptide repeat protein [Spirochaetaceae bacterium]